MSPLFFLNDPPEDAGKEREMRGNRDDGGYLPRVGWEKGQQRGEHEPFLFRKVQLSATALTISVNITNNNSSQSEHIHIPQVTVRKWARLNNPCNKPCRTTEAHAP